MGKKVVYTRDVDNFSMLILTVFEFIKVCFACVFYLLYLIIVEVTYPILKALYKYALVPGYKYIKRKWSGVEEIEYP